MSAGAEFSSPRSSPAGFSPEERAFLLTVARRAIQARLEERDYDPEPLTPRLGEPRAVFTTLRINGALRGCVGHVVAAEPLARAVASTAVSAAFADPRFPPVSREEFLALQVHLSVLSPLMPAEAHQIELGKHGLLVMQGRSRGLLLPEVPLDLKWDLPTFLAQTCLKAGLPPDAWQRGAQLFVFTTESFGE
ncbi:MAG TPA: AmmeMemoRadiSam system protein A [Terriglobales bacterium]|nr:AmmeMemoRadiSam system protein A [Terriglobales bacterium]